MTVEPTSRACHVLMPLEDAFKKASSEAVGLRAVPVGGMVSLRGSPDDPDFVAKVETATGVALALQPCTFTAGDHGQCLWLGPDEWLFVVDGNHDRENPSTGMIRALQGALHGKHSAVVDVSANRVILELSGPRARAVLEKACLLDLHPRAFTTGRVVGTMMARCQVFLQQTCTEPPTYRLYIRPSFARHMAAWIMDAMEEFGS